LIANNTALDCNTPFRIWDDKPYPEHRTGQVEVVNNLFFDALSADVSYYEALEATPRGIKTRPGNGDALLGMWRFRRNRRDFSGAEREYAFPAAPGDARFTPAELAARDAKDPDALRPVKGSSLADQGAGTDDPSLPVYIGALPPEGVEPWDWGRTWRARAPKPAPPDKDKPAP
jgi:hypothetical protein